MQGVIDFYFSFLWACFQTDISIYSNPWLWLPLGIPIMFYTVFFFFKWAFLLAPLSIAIGVVSELTRIIFGRELPNTDTRSSEKESVVIYKPVKTIDGRVLYVKEDDK